MKDLETELEKRREPYVYEVSFIGKSKDKAEPTSPKKIEVEMKEVSDEDEVMEKVEEAYENCSEYKITRLWNCGYWNCQDRSQSLCALCYE